jgi:hypothetical protein
MTSALYRIWWMPGQDRLTALCHCRARREWDDPMAAWNWLLDHPTDHGSPANPGDADRVDGTLQPVASG